jgi:hypothetical protein
LDRPACLASKYDAEDQRGNADEDQRPPPAWRKCRTGELLRA